MQQLLADDKHFFTVVLCVDAQQNDPESTDHH
jgi:hypothetical protein